MSVYRLLPVTSILFDDYIDNLPDSVLILRKSISWKVNDEAISAWPPVTGIVPGECTIRL